MNSKMQRAGREPSSSTRSLRRPCSLSAMTISPGWISRTKSAPMMSRPDGLAAEDRVALVVAEAERAHAVGIAEADHGVAAHHRGGEGAADLADGRAHALEQVALGLVGDERRDDLGVGGARELDPLGDELVAQLGGVDEVAVVAQGDDVAVAAAHQRLRVRPVAGARGAVAHVADGVLAAEALEHLLVEHLADEAEVLDDRDLAVVGHGDAGALLAAVLQGVEPEEGQARDVVARRVDAEDATAVVETIVVQNARFWSGEPLRERLISRMELAHRDGEELLVIHGTPQVGTGNPARRAVRQVAEDGLAARRPCPARR